MKPTCGALMMSLSRRFCGPVMISLSVDSVLQQSDSSENSLKRNKKDLIFTDFSLPGKNGMRQEVHKVIIYQQICKLGSLISANYIGRVYEIGI